MPTSVLGPPLSYLPWDGSVMFKDAWDFATTALNDDDHDRITEGAQLSNYLDALLADIKKSNPKLDSCRCDCMWLLDNTRNPKTEAHILLSAKSWRLTTEDDLFKNISVYRQNECKICTRPPKPLRLSARPVGPTPRS